MWLLRNRAAGVPAAGVADAAEAPAAGRDMGFQDLVDRLAQAQVGASDDPLADTHRSIVAAVGHRRDAGDELGLADDLHRFGAAVAVEGGAFDEHRALDLVSSDARSDIGQQVLQQIAAGRVVPEMMVRVADRQIRFENFLSFGGLRRRARH